MTTNDIVIRGDEKRALLVFARLIEAFEAKELSWFEQEQLPQKRFLPSNIQEGSFEHSCFLWFAAPFMRGGIKSDAVFGRLWQLYQGHLEIFVPQTAAVLAPSQLNDFIIETGLNYKSSEFALAWSRNAKGLEQFDWAPLNVFVGVQSCREVWQKLITPEFYGWREKIICLLISWLEEAGFIQPLFGPPAVDFHVVRFLIATKILSVEKKGELWPSHHKVVREARIFLEGFCEQHKIPSSSLSAAIWLLGRHCCAVQPKRCQWCPVEKYCRFFVPSVYYYGNRTKGIKGGRVRVELRQKPKQLHLEI